MSQTNQQTSSKQHKSGYVAIVGKPNAGKSTLMNAILGSKVSITTHKPQTTRHQVMGIYSREDCQYIFLDTPGMITPKYRMQEAMMRFVDRARNDADLVLFIVDAAEKNMPDHAFDAFKSLNKPVYLVINKMDTSSEKGVKPLREQLTSMYDFDKVIQISALKGTGMDELKEKIIDALPPGPPFYPKEIISEQPVRFFVAELIREQIYLQFHQEIPYSCAVDIIEYDERKDMDYIDAEIIVNRQSQKGIVIGKKGRAIKKLGMKARKAIQEFLDKKVYLDLHVKVREQWREKDNMLRNFGFD